MNFRLVLCIVMGVFTAHIGLFMLLQQFEPKPTYQLPAKPNFTSRAATVVDRVTGEKTTYRELTISTKLMPNLPEIIAETAAAAASKEAPESADSVQ